MQRYWITRFRDQEALALLRPALDRPEAGADPELFAAALLSAAITARYVDTTAALRLGEQAVRHARQLGARRLLIESLAALSAACYHAGHPERGLSPGQEAVQRARQLGDDVLLGVSLTEYLLCAALIHPDQAEPLLTEAIACTRRSGDQLFAYFVHNNAGVYALRAGDIRTARDYLHQAAQALQAIGGENPQLTISTGWVLRQDNDPGGARSSFTAALRASRRNGDRSGIAYRRDSLGQVRAHLGRERHERAHAAGTMLSFGQALDLVAAKTVPG